MPTKAEMEDLYEQTKRMLYHKAHAFSRSSGVNVSDLVSVGHNAFMKAAAGWDGKRRFSTYFGAVLYHEMLLHARSHDIPTGEEPEGIAPDPNPRQALENKEWTERFLAQLSEEARHVAQMMLIGPEALGDLGGVPPKRIRGRIHQYLVQQRKVGAVRAWHVLRELREALA
jgi:RNA polymerase sigma factor (sigma-70 family)